MIQVPRLPHEIEAESFRRIEAAAGKHGFPPDVWSVLRRMIHTTADMDYLQTARFHPEAVQAGVAAVRSGRPIVTDTRMVLAGISTGRLQQLGVHTHCLVDAPEVAEEARRRSTTRSATAMERAAPLLDGGIAAIGNAPTALRRLLEMIARRTVRPALVIGIPVGFVGAAESKEALLGVGCPYITALGPKGGSAVAAAVVNALAILALQEDRP